MSKFIGIGIAIVLTVLIGASLNGDTTASVKGSMNGLLNTSATQITNLTKNI